MKNKKGKNTIFDNIKASVRDSFGTIFNKVDNAFQNNNKSNTKEEKVKKEDIKDEFNDNTIESFFMTNEALEQKIEKKVNKKILQKKLSELRENINNIEDDLIEITKSEIDYRQAEEKILTLKESVEKLNEIYLSILIPNDDIIEDNLEFERLQIDKLMQMCDDELLKLTKNNYEIICTTIDENLKEQNDDIDQLRKTVKEKEYNQKRITLVTEIYNFLLKTIDIGMIILPNAISKNKEIGIMVSTIVINNRVRNMRKIMRKENEEIEFIQYKDIENEIKQEKCVNKIKKILDDTLRQVENLKQEFLMEFYYDMDRYSETEDIMAKLTSIEYEINSRKILLEEEY